MAKFTDKMRRDGNVSKVVGRTQQAVGGVGVLASFSGAGALAGVAGVGLLAAGQQNVNRGSRMKARASAIENVARAASGGSAALKMSAGAKAKYKSATKAHNAAAASRSQSASTSDGMTDAHARFSKGKTVQVGAYRTVTKK